jgi:hypothetical protein
MEINTESLLDALTAFEKEKRLPENIRPFLRAYRLVYENQDLMPPDSEAFIKIALSSLMLLIEQRHGANIGKRIDENYWATEISRCN